MLWDGRCNLSGRSAVQSWPNQVKPKRVGSDHADSICPGSKMLDEGAAEADHGDAKNRRVTRTSPCFELADSCAFRATDPNHRCGNSSADTERGSDSCQTARNRTAESHRERWRRRDRRRRDFRVRSCRSETMIRTTVALAAVVFLVGCGGSGHALPLPRDPYLGLRCHNPKVLRCRRVGLAVWLAQPARDVTAVVDGHDVMLHPRAGGTGPYRRGLFWEGSFADPSAQRIADAFGSASGSVSVRLREAENDGSISKTNSAVPLSEGYG
jgi:hypothetical protein